MPLRVDISVNGRDIERVHIARMAAISRTTGTYRYSAVRDPAADIEVEARWDEGVMFPHSTGDGALACVERALAALRGADNGGVAPN